MRNVFNFENRTVVIYGAAAVGIIVYDICKELNVPVAGFIDKRGDEIMEIDGLRVYSPDSREIDALNKDCILLIAVKNVFEHDGIVRKMIEKGFHNIIYRPYMAIKGNGNEDEKTLNEVYDKFMNKKLFRGDIPKSFSVHQYEYKDYATIKRREDKRIVYVPIECLYTDKKETKAKWGWCDIPILALIPHISFFKWLDCREGFSYDMYLKFCIDSTKIKGQIKVTERWKQNVIRNRANVYANMNEALERDFDFFIRNAPNAEWNTDGYFNLISGKHRAAFWVAKGRRYIPLKISDGDFEKWINKCQVDKTVEKLKTLNFFDAKALIEHPFFYELQCENKNLYFQLLCDFIYYIASRQYEKMGCVEFNRLLPVFISLDDDGYISRALQRYRIPVEACNKTRVNIILEDLIVVRRDACDINQYSYALIEFAYGQELDFADILAKKFYSMFCLVPGDRIEEFENAIVKKYITVKKREALKDGKQFFVYMLEIK